MSIEHIFVVNTGSHSVKVATIGPDDEVYDSLTIDDAPDSAEAVDALAGFLDGADNIAAVGHRVVHGGQRVKTHRVIDPHTREALDAAVSYDEMHMKPALVFVDQCREALPDIPHVACLDTAFHADAPERATTYPVPHEWREKHGIRRFGFHGLSHAWATAKAAKILGRSTGELSLVSVHLGGGSSACAVRGGRSVWSSMGFTPLEGLMMSTRSGSIDPGIVLWLQRQAGMSADEVFEALNHQAGLLGLSNGLSGDTRELVRAARDEDNHDAKLALDFFELRASQEIAAAVVSLGRLDAVVLTGEIGADQPEAREAIADNLEVIGVAAVTTAAQGRDQIISADGSDTPVVLVHPREELQMAHEVRAVIDPHGRAHPR